MPSRILKPFSPVRALVLCAALLYTLGAAAAELAPQRNQSGDVTVTVKPMDVSTGTATWSFQVTLKTHSQELNDDLASAAYIVDDAGKRTPATGWEGNAPGGHERKGILRFKALTPPPGTLELHIQRPGETAPRTFRWKLK